MGVLAQGHVVVPSSRQSRLRNFSLRSTILLLAACSMALILLCSTRFTGTQAAQRRKPSRRKASLKLRASMKIMGAGVQAHPRSWICPLSFDRPTFEEIKNQTHLPYLLGGTQRPKCRNCEKEQVWGQFCQFKSGGPVCDDWAKWRLLEVFLQRADAGAPGMKELLTMTPCDLFQLLEGRTMWIVGDSLSQDVMKAMQCFLSEFWDMQVSEVSELTQDPAALAALAKFPTGWCVHLMHGTRICHLRGNFGVSLVDDVFPHFPALGALPSDVVLFNFGVWHNTMETYSSNVTAVVDYLQFNRNKLPFLIWRDNTPQHFDTPLGEFGCDGCPEPHVPYQCKPIEGVELDARNNLVATDLSKQIVAEGGWRNKFIRPLMRDMSIPVLELWNQSVPLWEQHSQDLAATPNGDCTHNCHPSSYQLWIYQFYELLLSLKEDLPPSVARNEKPWRPKETA